MTPIDAWLHRQAEREKRLITLEDALLGNQARAYALYRLRYFSLRCVSSAILHGVRLTLLRYIFSHQAFLTTLLLNAIAGLVTSFWWGGLEVLRARVRHLSHDAQRHRIPAELGQWLTVATVLGGMSLLLPAGWIVWEHAYGHRAFDVLQLYIFAIGCRAGADFVTLMFHSGVYAVRRVYRPMPAMVAVELSSMLAVLALWPWLGRWSFPIAVILGTAVSAGLVVHYCTRLYRLLGWLPLRLSRPERSQFARWSTVAEFLAAGLSYALMKLDAFLMLAMFHARVPAPNGVSLFVFFVSISPAIQAGFDWAQLLYFDLKKLNTGCLRALRQRYERSAYHLAWVVGAVLWAFACVLGTVISGRTLGALYWLIGPFFIARSFLALAQIQAFSSRRYRALLASGAVLLAFMFALQIGTPSEEYKVLGLAVVSLLVTGWVSWAGPTAADEIFERRVLPVTDWLVRLQNVREPVRLRSLRFRSEVQLRLGPLNSGGAWADEDRWRVRRMAQRVAKKIRGCGAVTVLSPGQVAWYEVARARPRINRHALLRCGGGLVNAIASTHLEPDGVSALHAGLAMHVLGGPFANLRRHGSPSVGIQEVKRAFAAMFPLGVVYSPDDPIPEMLQTLSSWDRRRILFDGVQFAMHLHGPSRPGRFDVTSFCSGGELKLIFIVDRRCDRRQRTRWRAQIRAINVAAALAGTDSVDTGPDMRRNSSVRTEAI
ncbi:MAG TPA: hypothetical protein VMW56_05755 [Candidatus Margulisiibacteriota bacterium]|nr:hypothetical protein [Candidatus Margulisiibacteriota bacterium]